MAKMTHDDFEVWARNDCRGCMEQHEIDELFEGVSDFDTGEYTFRDPGVQGQWEAWQAALASICSATPSTTTGIPQ